MKTRALAELSRAASYDWLRVWRKYCLARKAYNLSISTFRILKCHVNLYTTIYSLCSEGFKKYWYLSEIWISEQNNSLIWETLALRKASTSYLQYREAVSVVLWGNEAGDGRQDCNATHMAGSRDHSSAASDLILWSNGVGPNLEIQLQPVVYAKGEPPFFVFVFEQ